MRLPGRMGRINETLAEQQMLTALDRGVNYFDTAYPYHSGKSEIFLGKMMARNHCRDRIKLATKLPHWMCSSKADMDRILDEQLERLQTDYIDYYLIHALDGEQWETAKENGVIEFMDQALAQGKILNAGFSFHGLAQEFVTIVDDYDWTFCQIQYNFLDTHNQAGTAGLEYAQDKGMAVMVMEPLRGGNLAKTPPPSVKAIWDRATPVRSPAQWSLSWIWNHPGVTVVLSGMNEDDHIRENIDMAEGVEPLSMADLDLVDEAAQEFRRVMRVGCTGCQYCMPCPAGVDIPSCFDCYNSKHAFKDPYARFFYIARNAGLKDGKSSMASKCVNCGKCLEKCPQHLQIPQELARVADDMEGWMVKPISWLIRRMLKVKAD